MDSKMYENALKGLLALQGSAGLCGVPKNALLGMPPDLLCYVMSLLSEDPIIPPDRPFEEWLLLISRLTPHKILPYIYWKISEAAPVYRPPDKVMEILRHDYQVYKARALRIEDQLADICGMFGGEGIEFLAMKGAALAISEYSDPCLRAGGDIDLLVLPEQVRDSRKVLEKAGYQCGKKYFDIARHRYCEEEFVYRGDARNKRVIEVHWDLQDIPRLRNNDPEQVFKRAGRVSTGGFDLKVLSPADALVHSAIHLGYKHRNEMRLIWIKDIDLLCRHLKDADAWDRLRTTGVEYHARLPLEISLDLARLWTGADIPRGIFSKWPAPTKSERKVNNYFISERSSPPGYLWTFWPVGGDLREKGYFLRRTVFPDADDMARMSPDSKGQGLPALYLKRLLRIAGAVR